MPPWTSGLQYDIYDYVKFLSYKKIILFFLLTL
jgi:hypothetical protein